MRCEGSGGNERNKTQLNVSMCLTGGGGQNVSAPPPPHMYMSLSRKETKPDEKCLSYLEQK